MSKVLKIAGKQVASGQRQSINIPVAGLYTHTEMTMPVHVLREFTTHNMTGAYRRRPDYQFDI